VPKAKIFTDREAKFLKELVKHKVAFMIVGLSAATLQGAPVVTQDIDLWFKDLSDPNFQKALKKVGAVYVPPIQLHPPAIAGADLDLFDIVLNMDGLGKFSDEIKNTVEVALGRYKIKVLSLERIIKSKVAAARPKDKLTLKVLRDTLKVLHHP
jgi:predicted nucleotidyltransferase